MRRILAVALLSLILGCGATPQFELLRAKGKTYRLNKTTGAVSLIDDARLVPLSEPRGRVNAVDEAKQLAELKSWPELSVPDNVKLNLKTSWRRGKLYFIVTASPISPKMLEHIKNKDTEKGFSVIMKDKNNFFLAAIPVVLTKSMPIPDASGKIAGLMMNSSLEMKKDVYGEINAWSASWNL